MLEVEEALARIAQSGVSPQSHPTPVGIPSPTGAGNGPAGIDTNAPSSMASVAQGATDAHGRRLAVVHAHPSAHPGAPTQASTGQGTQPGSGPEARRRSKLPILAAMVVLLAAAGVGGYFVTRSDSDSPTTSSSDGTSPSEDGDFDMSAWEDDTPQSRLAGTLVEDVFDDDPSNDSVASARGNAAEAPPRSHSAAASSLPKLRTYKDPAFGYRVKVPHSFEESSDGLGNATFEGSYQDRDIAIFTSAWAAIGVASEEQIQIDLTTRLAMLQLLVTESKWIDADGHRTLVGRLFATEEGQEGDFLLTRRGSTYYFAAIGGDPRTYGPTKKFRRRFLRELFSPGP